MSGIEPSDAEAQRRMQRQKRSGTTPELRLRRALHGRGWRFRIDHPPLEDKRRRGDIVFTRRRLVVFVDGCFWHRCPDHGTLPKSNAEWWRAKLDRNVERDLRTNQALLEAGWRVVRVWEHEEVAEAVTRVEAALLSGQDSS